jgi:hypothetical protein
MGRTSSKHGGEEECIIFWLENETERALARPRCRWEDNIKMDVRDIG